MSRWRTGRAVLRSFLLRIRFFWLYYRHGQQLLDSFDQEIAELSQRMDTQLLSASSVEEAEQVFRQAHEDLEALIVKHPATLEQFRAFLLLRRRR